MLAPFTDYHVFKVPQFVADVSTSFLFMAAQHSIIWLGRFVLSIHLLMYLWIVSFCFEFIFSVLLEVELLGYMGAFGSVLHFSKFYEICLVFYVL